jgi:hypothetical protein
MNKKFDGFIKRPQDSKIDDLLSSHFESNQFSPLESLNLFPVYARRQLLKRFLARVELFKMTLEVPGDIAELGVFRGFDLMTWANLLEIFSIGDRTKIVYGFDNWKGFEKITSKDGNIDESAHRNVGAYSPELFEESLKQALDIFDKDRFIPEKKRVELLKGDISITVPHFIKMNPGARFSLVHFDCDLYEPTLDALEAIWPRISRGGVVIFDEYALKDWPGETKAVDEFLEDKDVKIKTFPWTNSPAGYLIK